MSLPGRLLPQLLGALGGRPLDNRLREKIARALWEQSRHAEAIALLAERLINVAIHTTAGLPCLCKGCLGVAMLAVAQEGAVYHLDFVVVRRRFLFFWVPDSLLEDRPSLRRSVASALDARLAARRRKKPHRGGE